MSIKFFTNRASKVFQEQGIIFNKYLSDNNIKIKKKYFKYWLDRSFDQCYINKDENLIMKLIDRKHVNYISNKLKCSQLMLEYGYLRHYPMTYTDKSEIKIVKNKLYFVKNINAHNGSGVVCLDGDDLNICIIPKRTIIQEGITDIKLLDNKKFVIRVYLIIFNKKIYLAKDAIIIVHGENYDITDTSYHIHVRHKCQKRILLEDTIYKKYIYSIQEALTRIEKIFEPIVAHTDENVYSILGPDILIEKDGNIKILEFNNYPNLINDCFKKIVLPLYKLLFLNENDGSFLPCDSNTD